MKKINIKQKMILLGNIGLIVMATTIGCLVNTTTTTKSNNINNKNLEIYNTNKIDSFNINKISTKWTNKTTSQHIITNDFNEILNYNKQNNTNITNKNHISFISNVLSSLNSSNTKSNKIISALSTELNKLTINKQNQIKNQMLKMYNITSKEKINYKNIESILLGFTTTSNIRKVKNTLLKYQVDANNNLRNEYKISYVLMHAQFNFASNSQTTIGRLINSLNVATDVFAGISAAAATFAAFEYTLSWWFGISIPWAIASTAISVAAGAFSAGCGIAAMTYQEEANQLPYGWDTAITTFSSVYPLGTCMSTLIKLSQAVVTTVTLCSWAFSVAGAAISIALFILDIFNTIND